jgi:hypothetical protein
MKEDGQNGTSDQSIEASPGRLFYELVEKLLEDDIPWPLWQIPMNME